jgi:hypothetical protein
MSYWVLRAPSRNLTQAHKLKLSKTLVHWEKQPRMWSQGFWCDPRKFAGNQEINREENFPVVAMGRWLCSRKHCFALPSQHSDMTLLFDHCNNIALCLLGLNKEKSRNRWHLLNCRAHEFLKVRELPYIALCSWHLSGACCTVVYSVKLLPDEQRMG